MKEFNNFKEFYSFYLTQHQNTVCKMLHGVGTTLALLCLFVFLFTLNFYWLLLMPLSGYGFAWVGHFVFEKNKPATLKHPLYSLMADLVLFKDLITSKK